MITPDLIAYSDAGRAAVSCCCYHHHHHHSTKPKNIKNTNKPNNFWDFFGNTTEKEELFSFTFDSLFGYTIT